MAKRLLTGNEAIALGAHLAGARVVAGYPGTPSTEIIETLVREDYPEVYAEWAPNEKVALEVVIGASLSGVRAMATMKHVGVNVAADPLMTVTYMGVRGGLVIVTADDPGMHSSQNEQDNRNYARFAKVPMLEPSDSQEAQDMTVRAFALSETYDTPVFVRSTTRISHTLTAVEPGEPVADHPEPGFVRDQKKLVMIPVNARERHPAVEDRLEKLRAFVEEADDLNRIEWRDRSVGVVTGGIAYQYVREALPDASVLKLGISYPIPLEMIRSFAAQVDRLYVIEELDPFWESQMREAGIRVTGKEIIPLTGELTPDIIRRAVECADEHQAGVVRGPRVDSEVPGRPPMLCPGCPHRGVFYVLNRLKMIVTGDIGCYTLGVMPPLAAMDTCTCMGASIGAAMGIEKALGEDAPDTVAVIGDSTFLHSGMTALADVAYNGGNVTTIILDNHSTAMTGHQGNPASGYDARMQPAPRVNFGAVTRSLGIEDVQTVDPYDLSAVEEAVRRARDGAGPSVIIADRACALLDRKSREAPYSVTEECAACGMCLALGCPALFRTGDGEGPATIDPSLCTGCGMCAQVCGFDAIVREDDVS
ncbi:MAG: indolepyruvate ferredoxin oxidoreductase subunit alpha [Bacillota bacterium]